MNIIKSNELSSFLESRRWENNTSVVESICEKTRKEKDKAVREFTEKFDNVKISDFRISTKDLEYAESALDPALRNAILYSARNIKAFSDMQKKQLQNFEFETDKGICTSQTVYPIERAGVYVPGGRYPLLSSVLMGVVPAQVAGVREICVCTPTNPQAGINPALLATCSILGIKEVYAVGGAQAIAAMAYGTETIKAVKKIVGPGNKYVTAAKKYVCDTVGIDCLAGPTELMCITDENSSLDIVASDVLAQAEHDPDAQVIILCSSLAFAEKLDASIMEKLQFLPTRSTAAAGLSKHSTIVLYDDILQAIAIANEYAFEHISLQFRNCEQYAGKFRHYGSLFIGQGAAVAFGDYAAGINHTLPTLGQGHNRGGLSVLDFLKVQTTLRMNTPINRDLIIASSALAEAEGLSAHCLSVKSREKL